MNRRIHPPRRDEFQRLVDEARMQRAVYVSEAIAEAACGAWKALARGAAALRGRLGPAGGRIASRRPLATG